MVEFYSMGGKNNKRAVARTAVGFDSRGFRDLIKELTSVDQWEELNFTLDDKGYVADLASSNITSRLCSPKLFSILDSFSSNILWLPVTLTRGDEKYNYYFMHFPDVPDVLDKDKTTYAGDLFLQPHIVSAKVGNLDIFALRKEGSVIYVRSEVRKAIIESGCTGIKFEPARSS